VSDLLPSHKETLREIQNNLFVVGSHLATEPDQAEKIQLPALPENAAEILESEIDRMTSELPELKHFILPGGHPTVSHIHVARTVCRRTERTATALAELSTVNPIFIQYLNRLSDYLFTLSRAAAHELGAEENKWVPKKQD
jgi:cob(I)alamin adenosyltransferase